MNEKLTKDEIYKVLTKLIGEIEPVADSNIDEDRFENVKVFLAVFDEMHTQIDYIAYKHKNSLYASTKKIGEACAKYLGKLGED